MTDVPVIDFDTAEAMGLDGTLRTAREVLYVILNDDLTQALGHVGLDRSALVWTSLPFAYTWDTPEAAENYLRVVNDDDGTVYATRPADGYVPPREADGTVSRFAWPGGYRIWFITHDGADLCAECVQAESDQTLDPTNDTGWRVVGHYHEGEADTAGPCDHCGHEADTEELR